MTKGHCLTLGTSRNDLAGLHLLVADENAIDEETLIMASATGAPEERGRQEPGPLFSFLSQILSQIPCQRASQGCALSQGL